MKITPEIILLIFFIYKEEYLFAVAIAVCIFMQIITILDYIKILLNKEFVDLAKEGLKIQKRKQDDT